MREWLLRSETMREARVAADAPAGRRRAQAQAQLLAELARRVAEPVDALPTGSYAAAQLALCRDATYWALVAMQPSDEDPPPADLATLWERAPAERLELAAGGRDEADSLRRTLVDGAPAYSLDTTDALAARARRFIKFLVADLDAPRRRIERLAMQRWTRLGLLAMAVLLIGYGARVLTRGPNLVEGKPFRTSSDYAACQPPGTCEGIFFHTQQENNPWVEFDLGAPRAMKRIEVTNRLDCCEDRAAPLVVEISSDRTTWTEVARRDTEFAIWKTSFPRTTGRYLRLRVPRPTQFHLKEVVVR
jgi:hypothetical protein